VSEIENERFALNVLACVDDINRMLPRLAHKYADLEIVAALAEHVEGTLRIFMESRACSVEQVREVLAHIERTAFPPPV
jgi:hypothetical protein